MEYLGVPFSLQNTPKLDPHFVPFGVWSEAYRQTAGHPIALAVERQDGAVCVYRTMIHNTPAMAEADLRYVERCCKFLLWSAGGFRLSVCGCSHIAQQLQGIYSAGGARSFDFTFVRQLYERDLEIVDLPLEDCPAPRENARKIGGHTDGCRIGFDAGGSDRKVSAVIDGECVYSEEVLWSPKLQEDPDYHFRHIVEALKTAAGKMPRVDAIGVSSAGVFVGNAPMVSSLFIRVPQAKREQVKSIFDRAAAQIGDVPVVVANDGDVSALSGAMGLGKGNLMGIAMGTSQAVGYVDENGCVLGRINELAFAPVDLAPDAPQDEWSCDRGVGCKYFSQDAVIRLAPAAGIDLPADLSLAEQLAFVQALAEDGDSRAADIFETIGAYLAYTAVLYSRFYPVEHLLLMGRVMSGKGGEVIAETCRRILAEEFPALSRRCAVLLPDEKTRRIGQSVAAATLPELR